MKNDSPITSPNIPMAKVRPQELQMYVKSSELPTSMTAIRLWRQLCVRKYLDEGKSLHTVLSVFAQPLHDEIKTYYHCCLDDDDYPFTISNPRR